MTTQVQPAAIATDDSIVSIILGANGDLLLAAERTKLNPTELTERFVSELVNSPDSPSRIKALMLLNLISLFSELTLNIKAQLPEFNPGEALKALELISNSILSLTGSEQITQPAAAGGGNTYNFMGESVVDRIAGKLAAYTRPVLVESDQQAVQQLADPTDVDKLVSFGRHTP